MSETKAKLAAIDDGDFENLVIFYLRQKYPHLKGLIQTGINEKGEAIKCKVDGILYVHETGEAVSVAITVTEIKDLTRKWLGGKKGKSNYEKGDIVKASEEFAEWRKTQTTSKLKLYLAVNSFLESNTSLYKEAITKGKSAGLEVEIIEASILIPFLDFDSEGQYIRQEILKIKSGRLSESLFRKLANDSLEQHRSRFFIGTNKHNEIKRNVEKEILKGLKSEQSLLIGVQSSSGLGKSTVVRNVGETINSNEGVCFWCPAEIIQVNHNIIGLLQDTLKNFSPSLDNEAGEKAIEILGNLSNEFILIIDDINRISSPRQILDSLKIISQQAKEMGLNIKFLVPLWNNQFYSQTLSKENNEDWTIINLQNYANDEKQQITESLNSKQSERLSSLMESLNGDPFLCGLARKSVANELIGKESTEIISEIIDYALLNFFNLAIEIDNNATQSDFKKSLDCLVRFILQNDNPEPIWSEIKDSIGENNAKLILTLCKTNQFFSLETNSEFEILRWRHERLRDAVIGKWLLKHIIYKDSTSITEFDNTVISAPGLAEAWALAVLFTPANKRENILYLISDSQPIALAELLKLNLLDEEITNLITEELQKHFNGWKIKDRFTLDKRWQTLNKLRQIDNLKVLDVTKNFPNNWWVNLIRFRNGDVTSGIYLIREFHPESHFKQIEEVIEIFRNKRQNEKDEIGNKLFELAKNKELIFRIFTLIGYLGWVELAQVACDIWINLPKEGKIELLVYFVWALNRCGDIGSQKHLEESLHLTKELSDEKKDNGGGSERYWKFFSPIRHSLRWGVTDDSVKTWISIIEQDSELNLYTHLLGLIDNKISLETYIKIRAKGDFAHFDFGEFSEDDHGELTKANSFQRSRLPTKSDTRDYLWEIITSEKNNKIREWAFRFWRRSATSLDFDKLNTILETDYMFDDVLRLRVLLKDKSATDKLVEKMKNSPEKWCGYCYPLCSNEIVADTLINNIEKAYEDIYHQHKIERLPNLLPTNTVKKLISEKREWLKSKPRIWTGLWGSDVPEALEFVQCCIREAKPKDIEHFFTISGNYNPLTQRMLDTITPVFECFSEKDRGMFAWQVSSDGFPEWAEKNYKNPSDEYKEEKWSAKKSWLTTQDALAVLNVLSEKVSDGIDEVRKTDGYWKLERNRELCFDLGELLKSWMLEEFADNKVKICSYLLISIGKGIEVDWWKNIKPNENSSSFQDWENTLFLLKRRRWQIAS